MVMCEECQKLLGAGRKTPPHGDLVAGEFREVRAGGMRADEQDYECRRCGRKWMHETGNHGEGWIYA